MDKPQYFAIVGQVSYQTLYAASPYAGMMATEKWLFCKRNTNTPRVYATRARADRVAASLTLDFARYGITYTVDVL